MVELSGQRVLVLGLGVSGRSAAAFCSARGAHVTAADERPADALAGLDTLHGIELRTGGQHPDVADFDLVVPSPGVPRERWAGARRALGDVEIAQRALSVPVIAVTGTNGKTTTVALLERMLRAAGLRAEAAGNIGRPALDLVGRQLDVAVLEVSSFQLEATERFRPHIAVILNVTPDHLDRHGDFAAYVDAKARIVACQQQGDFAIADGDDAAARGIAEQSLGQPRLFRRSGPVSCGAWWDVGAIVLRGEAGEIERITPARDESAASPPETSVLAGLLACHCLGADVQLAARGLVGFEAPAHRRELVANHAGISWIDDSKATNPAAALYALRALRGPAVWIAGGQRKGLDLAPLVASAADRVRAGIWIGEAAQALDDAARGRFETRRADSIEAAVAIASEIAHAGDTVLLSPACASLDQFRSYAERGERFRAAVEARLAVRDEAPGRRAEARP